MKKRYSRIRNEYKKSKRSGTGRKDVQKAEDHYYRYSFLFWLDPFIKLRNTQNNFSDNDNDEIENFEEKEDDDEDDVDNDDDDAPDDALDDSGNRSVNSQPYEPYESSRDDEGTNRETIETSLAPLPTYPEISQNRQALTSKVTGKEKWVKKKKPNQNVEVKLLSSINKRLTSINTKNEQNEQKHEDNGDCDAFGKLFQTK